MNILLIIALLTMPAWMPFALQALGMALGIIFGTLGFIAKALLK